MSFSNHLSTLLNTASGLGTRRILRSFSTSKYILSGSFIGRLLSLSMAVLLVLGLLLGWFSLIGFCCVGWWIRLGLVGLGVWNWISGLFIGLNLGLNKLCRL